MRIRVKEKRLQLSVGRFVRDDDVIILSNYRIYQVEQVMKALGLCILLFVLSLLLYIYPRLPQDLHVKPVEKVYAIQDNSPSHYKAYVTSIFGKEYPTNLASIDVCFGIDDSLDVRASLFGLFRDKIRVIPIAKADILVQYATPVYEGDFLDEKHVKVYQTFVDGHKIEQNYDVSVPDGEVRGPFQICVTVAQFHRFYTTIEPIMSEKLVAEYDSELYECESFDTQYLRWYLAYTDGTRRQLDDVKFTMIGDSSVMGDSVVISAESKYQSNEVTLYTIPVKQVFGEYQTSDVLYFGDKIDLSDVNLTVEWEDGRVLYLSGTDVTDKTYYTKSVVTIPSIYGDVTLHMQVVGVQSVELHNQADVYYAGSVVEPQGLVFTYTNGVRRNVPISEILLSDDWFYPLSEGWNNLDFSYRGMTYTWRVNAIPVVVEEPDSVIPNDDPDIEVEQPTGENDDIIWDNDTEQDTNTDVDEEPSTGTESDDDIIIGDRTEPDDGIVVESTEE